MARFSSTFAPALVVASAIAVSASAWIHRERAAVDAEREALAAAVGAVPLFVAAPAITLLERDGAPVPLANYRGRMVLVNFWATWCGPCKAEMPSMIALHSQLDPADIAFVAIAEDDTWPPLDAYLARQPLPFDVFRDRPPRVEIAFETGSYPTTFLIDRDGTALYRFNGARDWTDPQLRELLALWGVDAR